MVVLNRIYTRTGDDGTTALGTGERRKKYDLRVSAYGTVDELNAAIGVARLHVVVAPEVDAVLARVQNDLFDLGADLCSPDQGKGGARLTVSEAQVTRLEQEIDGFNSGLAPLRSFVLPGGSPGAAHVHVARTVCRRAERLVIELSDHEPGGVSGAVVKYLNRLSDLLFVLSRVMNRNGAEDVLWVPGQNR
jgi:cob(I)alamin adenosyltransferase